MGKDKDTREIWTVRFGEGIFQKIIGTNFVDRFVDRFVDAVDKQMSTLSTLSTRAVDSANPHKYWKKRYLSTLSTRFL